ncbi:MAG: phosphoribosylanthranilate isomerase [Alphaproteobacteria bacterium]|nr:phosphoribosylanthranilate isomerase [Verrucomicrobiota bacterium]MBV9570410.1 phosphoribosylanthranilate isomerase [Alphaproteobacteria bacterium]
MVQVKICGINSPAAADAVASAGADYAGFVFFPPSPRHVGYGQASSLSTRLRGRCRVVAVVVDATDPEIEAAVNAARPGFLQLHGKESPERVVAIRQRFAVPVIKAISIADKEDLQHAPAFEAVADLLLFDAKAPNNTPRPGGHGAAFDWRLLNGRRLSRPWLLGGGLNPENVVRAIRACDAPGVDCSSGVETAPGLKDPNLIREFIAAARATQFAGAES